MPLARDAGRQIRAPRGARAVTKLFAVARNVGTGLIPVAIGALVWEAISRSGHVSPALLPSIGSILSALYQMGVNGSLISDVGSTFERLLKSVVIGIAIGTLFGTAMGYFRIWERLFNIPLNFLLSIPGTALFPLSLIWFGLNEWAILSILIYEVALTVTTTTWTGVKSIDMSLIRAARAYGANGLHMLWRVLIPAALPAIISGYRIAFSRAWRILIIAEMLVSVTSGLGYRLYWAREFFHTEIIYAGLLVVGLCGLLLERVLLRTLEIATVQRWGMIRELS
jgi:ABC-type nitrate/sulfonate/bicarbonate transport system permease component